jgi:flagellar basal body-associated protein FliL
VLIRTLERKGRIALSLGIAEGLTQVTTLLAVLLVLVLLAYLSGKALHLFSHQSSKNRHQRDDPQELLQFLIISELLGTHLREPANTNLSPSTVDQEA